MSQYISELRKEKKLTQKDLAEKLGVTDKAVSKWERGLSYPDVSLLSKLSHILGVTTDELLNGEKAQASAPHVDIQSEAALQHSGAAPKNGIGKKSRWQYIPVMFVAFLLVILVLIGCVSAIDRGLTWSVLPGNITVFVWLAVISALFILGKKKAASLSSCGFVIFMMTFYYSSLNQTQTRDIVTYGPFNGFSRDYIPHYTIILAMLIVSIVLAVVSGLIQNKKMSTEKPFLLITASLTIIIISILTVSSIMDYVDIHGLGVNSRYTILLLFTLLMNFISLTLSAKLFYTQKIINK